MIAIVGGGITGLAAAHRLTERMGPGACVLFEAEMAPGGKVRTVRVDGFTCEDGPDALPAARPEGVALCRALGLDARLTGRAPAAAGASIRRGDRLFPLPMGLTGATPLRAWSLGTNRLLPVAGRLRALLEIAVPRRRRAGDESIAGFMMRRFGRDVWEQLAEPLLAGIHAGEGADLSLAAVLPRLHALERTRRSILLAGLGRPDGASRAAPPFLTLPGGLGHLTEAVVRALGPATVRCGTRVLRIARRQRGWRLVLQHGEQVDCDGVLCATPAHATAPLVEDEDPLLAELLAAVPFASCAVVTLAWPGSAVRRPCAGSGWLVPRREGGGVIAVSQTSVKFPTHAPAGALLVRVFLGRDPDALAADDAGLIAAACAEVTGTLGITGSPVLTRVARWPRALPRYTVGHGVRVARIEQRVALLPGLRLAGCSYRGVGLADCIAGGQAAAEHLAALMAAA